MESNNECTVSLHNAVPLGFQAAELLDLSPYKNVTAWLSRCKAEMEGYDEACGQGAAKFGAMLKSKLAQ